MVFGSSEQAILSMCSWSDNIWSTLPPYGLLSLSEGYLDTVSAAGIGLGISDTLQWKSNASVFFFLHLLCAASTPIMRRRFVRRLKKRPACKWRQFLSY